MKRLFIIGGALILAFGSAVAAESAQEQALREAYIEYQCQQVQPEEQGPGAMLVVVPQYFRSNNSNMTHKVKGTELYTAKGHANGGGITLLGTKRFSEYLSLGLTYEFGFMRYNGGGTLPYAAHMGGAAMRLKENAQSHVVGGIADVNLKQFGKFQFSVIQGFDFLDGDETRYTPTGGVDMRSTDDNKQRVTSLMAWYEKDFNLCNNWTLGGYAGWRTLYAHIMDQNNWNVQANSPFAKQDTHAWIHLASGGLKLAYQNGPFGFSLRGGINHRTTKDNLPGYANRATAPGVVQFAYHANVDRTVGTFGAGVSYAINPRCIVTAGYDAYVGKDTNVHTGTLGLVFPF